MPAPLFPGLAPTIDSNAEAITVSMFLKNSPQMLRAIYGVIDPRQYLTEILFENGPTTESGAVLYDVADFTSIQFTDRDLEQIAVGAEYPELGYTRRVPRVASTAKYGGRVTIPEEEVDRNNTSVIRRVSTLIANTARRKVDGVCNAALQAAATLTSTESASWANPLTQIYDDIMVGVDQVENGPVGIEEGYVVTDVILGRQANLNVRLNSFVRSILPRENVNQSRVNGAPLDGLFGIPRWTMSPFIGPNDRWLIAGRRVGVTVVEKPFTVKSLPFDENDDTYAVKARMRFTAVVDRPKAALRII